MSREIFRKKSLDKIKSPENLDDYIRVANPSVWFVLVSVIILLAGACIWGFFGRIDSTVPSAVSVKNGNAVCYISEENISVVKVGMTVKFADYEAVILSTDKKTDSEYICTLSKIPSLSDGLYRGTVTVKSYKPLSFVLN